MWARRQFILSAAWTLSLMGIVGADESNDTCGLYLAVSSTSTAEATKWGMFAGKDIPADTKIGSSEAGVMIPHLRANHRREEDDESLTPMIKVVDFFEEFFWVPDTAAAKYELSSGRSIAAVPGAGVLASYYGKSTNADWEPIHAYFRPVQGEESGVAHPNRGAHSPFYNIQVVSKSAISAGSEIFMEFGSSWEEKEGEDDLSKDDFTKIDETVDQMIEFFKKYQGSLDEDSALEIYSFLTKDVMKAAVGAAKARKVATILPPKPADLHLVPAAGGALKFSDPSVHRNVDWLLKYGLCMDNIKVGASTIPNAGRGAIATRAMAAGSLVTPVPLTHVPNKDVLNMYKLTTSSGDDGYLMRESDTVVTQQLVLNYCLGHPQSSMVFFPTGSAATVINHSDEPNAKLVWSQHPSNQKMWLQLEPDELFDEDHLYLGLVMEVVATRDIAPGEEVFIDYGPEWKEAYAKHVASWNAKVASGVIPSAWPLRAIDMNGQYHTTGKPFPTPDELKAAPFPDNVMLKAFLLLAETDNDGTMDDPKVWSEGDEETAYHHDNLFDMTVIRRAAVEDPKAKGGPFTYVVEWINGSGKTTIVTGVPHDALVFVDKPGTSDQFATEHAFRHYIGIPDEIFPQGPWRNL